MTELNLVLSLFCGGLCMGFLVGFIVGKTREKDKQERSNRLTKISERLKTGRC